MVASANNELYTPFPKGIAPEEGFQSSEEGSDLHSPVFEQPFPHFTPEARYHPIASDSLPHTGVIASPTASRPYTSIQHTYDPQTAMSRELPSIASSLHYPPPNLRSFASPAYAMAATHGFVPMADASFERPVDMMVPDQPVSLPQIAPMPQAARTFSPQTTGGDAALVSSSSAGGPSTSTAPSRAGRSSRSNVSNQVIACRLCRSRKIRCDSTRPECNNCLRRHNECIYDVVPKRRGPDKNPGTRQRSCKKRPTDGSAPQPRKRRKTDPADELGSPMTSFKEDASSPPSVALHAPLQVKAEPDLLAIHALPQPSPAVAEAAPEFRVIDQDAFYRKRRLSPTFPRSMASLEIDSSEQTFNSSFDLDIRSSESFSDSMSPSIPPVPSTQYNRKMWWDNLLNFYSPTREQAVKDITEDLNILFSTSNYWLTFFHMPSPLRELHDRDARSRLQPSVVLAGLALATLMKSSEMELGAVGRDRALWLRDEAHSSLEASWQSQWIDLNLAKAAVILALFETSAHPQYSTARAESALRMLDDIIHALHLTSLDANDSDPLDHSSGVPTVVRHATYVPRKECECINLPQHGAQRDKSWSFIPAWDAAWSPMEIRNEETRRLCWCALILVSNHTVACAAAHRKPLDLHLIDSSNYHLLFPGEYHQRSSRIAPHSGKDTVWALYCRSMLLWNGCTRFQDESLPNDVKAQLAIATYVEIGAVEEALDAHICNIDTALIYMCREFISNTRLAVTYMTRRMLLDIDVSAPVWNRPLAEDWLRYQRIVAERVKSSIHRLSEAPVHLFLRRPFQISWYTSQVAICITIFNGDNGLPQALHLASDFMEAIEVLNALWPCPAYRRQSDALRDQLREPCARAGLPLPPIPDVVGALSTSLIRV